MREVLLRKSIDDASGWARGFGVVGANGVVGFKIITCCPAARGLDGLLLDEEASRALVMGPIMSAIETGVSSSQIVPSVLKPWSRRWRCRRRA